MRWLENYGAHVVGASVAASAPARANDASITGEARTNIHATLRAFASAGGWALAAHENAAAMNDKPRRRQHAAELIDEAFATYEIAPQPRTTNASVAARSPRSNRWEDGRYHHLQPSVYRVEYEEAFTSIRSGETLHAGRYSCIS